MNAVLHAQISSSLSNQSQNLASSNNESSALIVITVQMKKHTAKKEPLFHGCICSLKKGSMSACMHSFSTLFQNVV